MNNKWYAAACVLFLSSLAGAVPEGKPRIAVVIDDFGLTYAANVKDDAWLAVKWPVTYAVMPESPRTKKIAGQIKQAGQEMIIHFPFDPFLSLELLKDKVSAADQEKVQKLLEKSFRDIPGSSGLNTHRSYKATMNRPLMEAFMKLLKPRGGYFLDSRAAPKSIAAQQARLAGIPALANDFFLEDGKNHDKAFCVKILRRAAAYAKKHGSAVVIGHHYYHGTYEGLIQEVPKLQSEGFEFVYASALAR